MLPRCLLLPFALRALACLGAVGLGACTRSSRRELTEGESIEEQFFELARRAPSSDTFAPKTVGELADARACSTAPLAALTAQIAAEVNCLRPGLFSYIGDIPNVVLGPAASPWLERHAAATLRGAAARRASVLTINSAWRSPAQQYVLKHWEGSCGIGDAAPPGHSAHEAGLAIDVSGGTPNLARELRRDGFRWYCDVSNGGKLDGCHDPPHYLLEGGKEVRGVSVVAFQRLWNRAHASDTRERLDEDGELDAKTESALRRAPLGGFNLGPGCRLVCGVPSTALPSQRRAARRSDGRGQIARNAIEIAALFCE